MKNILFTLAGFALLSSGNAWALSGGPFGNGDPAGLLTERAGFYQCTFSFKNGNGYGVFTPDSQIAGGGLAAAGGGGGTGGGGGGGGAQANFYYRGSIYTPNSSNINRNANRSVFYYKAVTYVGGCLGMVDLAGRSMNGICNATSDYSLSLSQSSGGTAGTAGTAGTGGTTTQSTTVIVQNDRGYILNLGWNARITSTRPILRFQGRGEMAIIEPGPSQTSLDLLTTAYTDIIDNLTSAFNTALTTPSPLPPGLLPLPSDVANQFLPIINAVLDDFAARTEPAGINDTDRNAQKVRVTVNGNRRFF